MEARVVSSRPFLFGAAGVVVLIAGVIGAVAGSTGQQRGMSMTAFGVPLFEMTPVTMAAFGMLLTAGALTLLFLLVAYASQYDTERVES